MNINKAKILLDKINVLMRSMAVSPEQIAEIEKDLMKSYVRQLYDTILTQEATGNNRPTVEKIIKTEPKVERVVIPEPIQPKPDPPKPAPEPVPVPVVEVPAAPKPRPIPKAEVELEIETTPPPKPVSAPIPKKQPVFVPVDEELEELFNLPNATDLSEKLSQSHIKDLTKAFSINEKLFTVKELFGGDNDLFNETLSQLNKLNSFEEAKKYLASGVASKAGWTKKSKKNKAKEFVKTVKRRYS